MSSEEQNKLFGGKAAVILGAVMLAGFGVLSAFAALDRRERATLEQLDQPTAAGDTVVYQLPAAAPIPEGGEKPAPIAVLTRDGVPLFDRGEDDYSDGTMMKAGMDDAGKIPLYRRLRGGKLKESFYLKLGPERFLELGPAKAVKVDKPAEPTSENQE